MRHEKILEANISKTLGPKAAHLVTTLYELNKPIFKLKDIQDILQLEDTSSRNFARKLVNRGVATRLKAGLFILVPFELGKEREYIGNPMVAARELAGGKDYYLSYSTAMEIHKMVTQPQLVINVSTLKPRKPVFISGTEVRFVHTPKPLFFGLYDHWATNQEKVTTTDLERTVIDGLNHPEYCGGITEVAKGLWIRREDINPALLVDYALRIGKGVVIRRLGYLLELYKIGSAELLETLRQHLSESYARLDPLLATEGKFLRRWRLQLNVSPEELLSVVKT